MEAGTTFRLKTLDKEERAVQAALWLTILDVALHWQFLTVISRSKQSLPAWIVA